MTDQHPPPFPPGIESTLARIDERTANLAGEFARHREHVEKTFVTMQAVMVTKVEFSPVKAVVFGLVGVILLSVIGAVIAGVIVTRGGP